MNEILKERWFSLSDNEKHTWKRWEQWDAKRYAHEMVTFRNAQNSSNEAAESEKEIEADASQTMHVPKKRKLPHEESRSDSLSIPKKSRH